MVSTPSPMYEHVPQTLTANTVAANAHGRASENLVWKKVTTRSKTGASVAASAMRAGRSRLPTVAYSVA